MALNLLTLWKTETILRHRLAHRVEGPLCVENLCAPCFGQCVALQGKVLVYGRNAGIADQHSFRREHIIGDGRVEDGRGSWGPMAITPFPISAHRTGGPDFRSPALRLASPQGTRRGSEWQAFEAQHTEFPIDSVVREPAGAAPCHFVPSCEEVTHALVGIAVNTAEC